jgi:hypothetical protein
VNEVINGQLDKRGFWRRATAIAGGLALLTACDQQPQITEGTVYQKEYIKKEWVLVGRIPTVCEEIEREGVTKSPSHEKSGAFCEVKFPIFVVDSEEKRKIYIAQCPKGELPPPDKIEKECKTNSFDVSEELYPALKIGQHTDFKKDHF